MKHKHIFVLLLFLSSACGIYHPQSVDIPLISEKNDLRIDAGISVVPSACATISYGLTNKIALQAYGSVGPEKRSYFQIAPGLFRKSADQKVMEIYCGFGYGYGYTTKNIFADDLYAHNFSESLFGNYQIYFAQFNFGKKGIKSGRLDWGYGIRTGLFHSDLMDQNYYNYISDTGPFPTYIENSVLLEPSVFVRTGRGEIRFTCKLGLDAVIKLTNTDHYIPAPTINLGIGLNFTPKKHMQDLISKR